MAAADVGTFLDRLARRMAADALADRTDRELVELALAGPDEVVFRVLVRRHGAMVFRVCRRVLRHHHDAEDAFQATFLVLARKLGTVRRHTSLASWLHGVAHRVALQARDRAAVRRRHERQTAPAPDPRPDDLTRGEEHVVLDAELRRLPEKWRLPLVLCYLEGRTQDEAAALLGWGKTTLRNRLGEARAALGRRLRRCGVGWSASLSALLLSDAVAPAAPPGLVASTVRAAAGRPADASPVALTLTEEMMRPTILTTLHAAAAGLVVAAMLAAGATGDDPPRPTVPAPPVRGKAVAPPPAVDLTKLSRAILKEPAYAGRPRYGLLVLGPKAETRVWLVIDGDTLYVDRNGNGDLTEPGERVAAKRKEASDFLEFRAGPFTEADGKTRHSDLIVSQYFAQQYGRLVNDVAVLDVRGTLGQGTSGENGGVFADAPKDAPVVHVNGPLTLRPEYVWVEYAGGNGRMRKDVSEVTGGLIDVRANNVDGKDVPYTLKSGERVILLGVQVGTPGIGPGTFAAVAAQRGFPAGLHPVVEVSAPSARDPRKRVTAEYMLRERGGTTHYGDVALPRGAAGTTARLALSFPAWEAGKVAPAVIELPMAGPPAGGKLGTE
ncbi:sigma-70 family RNA polymerase sigma factor [bacterium]|nr:sigma-70 family RNA polymerase sigma factor [bacterium]